MKDEDGKIVVDEGDIALIIELGETECTTTVFVPKQHVIPYYSYEQIMAIHRAALKFVELTGSMLFEREGCECDENKGCGCTTH